jgi:ATP adenylyltransferase
MDRLYAPWRSAYLMSEPQTGCLFCRFVDETDDRANLILARGARWFVIINRYPYTTGHVMVVCNRHVDRMTGFDEAEGAELVQLLARCERAIVKAYAPDGINVGANLGRSAGAGIAGHFHMHLVPRWQGDTNFMSSVGETRVVSEALEDTYDKLLAALAAG